MIVNHIEAMKLALEALESLHHSWAEARLKAIAAIKQALAQPVQEPVAPKIAAQLRAMACNYPAGHLWDKLDAKACIEGALLLEGRHPKAPPAAQRQSARSAWVGLTDEQINALFEGMEPNNGFWLSFARTIEAKLKEKNT